MSYAVLRQTEDEFDPLIAAGLLAPILGHPRADLQQELLRRPGILAEQLKCETAYQAAAVLCDHGIPAQAVENDVLVDPPPLLELRGGCVLEEGIGFETIREKGFVPWQEVVFFDVAEVQTRRTDKETKWEPSFDDEGERSRERVTYTKLVTGWQGFLDVVSYEPWFLLRVKRGEFKFAATGLPVHATSDKNLSALAVVIRTRCPAATAGRGFELMFDGDPQTQQRVNTMAVYDNLLRWRLTRLFRTDAGE
jgi:hypothetical protein